MAGVDSEQLAERLRAALDTGVITAFADLLDPRVTCSAPGDSSPPCQNREHVVKWYWHGLADGRRGRVLDVVSREDKLAGIGGNDA